MQYMKEVLFLCIEGDRYHTLILLKALKEVIKTPFKTLIRVENIGYYSKKAKAIVCDKVKAISKVT